MNIAHIKIQLKSVNDEQDKIDHKLILLNQEFDQLEHDYKQIVDDGEKAKQEIYPLIYFGIFLHY